MANNNKAISTNNPPTAAAKDGFSIVSVLLWSFVLLAAIAGTVLLFKPDFISSISGTGLPQTQPSPTPVPTPEPPKPVTVLLLGYGGGGHDGGRLTDTIMLARIDPVLKLISLISIPRDLWVPLNLTDSDQAWNKINAAYAIGSDQRGYQARDEKFKGEHGGGTLAKQAVALVTDIEPSYYAAVDFASFIRGIDTIGELTVDVPYTFDDYFYPVLGKEKDPCGYTETDIATITATFKDFELEKQFPCRYEHLHFDKGETTMDGETALKFVRSRHSGTGGGDFGRSQRQQALINAVVSKVFSLSFLPKLIPLAQQLAASVGTDFPITQLPEILAKIGNVQEYTIHSVTLTTSNVLGDGRSANRQYILQPKTGSEDWASIQTFIQSEMFTATQSAQLDPEASPSADLSE